MEDWPRAVGGAIVDDNDSMRHASEDQLGMQVLDSGCDAAFLVAGGNDDEEEAQGRAVGDW